MVDPAKKSQPHRQFRGQHLSRQSSPAIQAKPPRNSDALQSTRTVPRRGLPLRLQGGRRFLHCQFDDPRSQSRQSLHRALIQAPRERLGEVYAPRRPEPRKEHDHVADAPRLSPRTVAIDLPRRPATHGCAAGCSPARVTSNRTTSRTRRN